jgi:hypothetical protein
MHALIVMDHTGDSRHHFDPSDDAAVADARVRFEKLKKDGYIAAKRTDNGTSEMIRQLPAWSINELEGGSRLQVSFDGARIH